MSTFVPPTSADEKLVGSNIDVRTLLHFRLPEHTVQALLPSGWEVEPPTAGPAAGANLRVTMIDPIVAYDAEGLPRSAVCFMHLGIPARRQGTQARGLMLFTGLSPSGPGPYATSITAVGHVERVSVREAGNASARQSWSFTAGGTSAALRVSFARQSPTRESASVHVYSRAKPEFYRVYRFDQGVEVLCGDAARANLLQQLQFETTGEPFTRLFDGKERLVSVVSLPWYARRVYLPRLSHEGR